MLDLEKKTDQLKLLMSAGYNRIMAERFLQPSNIAYSCVIWKEKDFDFPDNDPWRIDCRY